MARSDFQNPLDALGFNDLESQAYSALLQAPAALGCIKNDFAGQQHEDDWARCLWDHAKQDYDCTTSEGEFFLISGKKIQRQRTKRRK